MKKTRKFRLSGVVDPDFGIDALPCARLSKGLGASRASGNDSSATYIEAMGMKAVHVDQADKLIRISLADLGPGQ